jgi:hypothetical protein
MKEPGQMAFEKSRPSWLWCEISVSERKIWAAVESAIRADEAAKVREQCAKVEAKDAAAEAVGLKARLNDDEISRILDGVRRQVEWNGWEEPFVTNRFKSELSALNKKKPSM